MKQVFLMAIILFSKYGYCQNDDKPKFKLPPLEITFNINKLDANVDISTNEFDNVSENKVGFGLNINRIWMPEKRFSIITGLNYNHLRYFSKYFYLSHQASYINTDFNIMLFSIPLLLRASIGSTYKFFLEAGPTLNYIIDIYGKGTEITYNQFSQAKDTIYNNNTGSAFEQRPFGGIVGLGLRFNVAKVKLILSGAYQYDMKRVLGYYSRKKQYDFFIIKMGIFLNSRYL
jgi:hypothetical protein